MPGLVAYNRRWDVGSDDFVFPGIVDILGRTFWLTVVAVVFSLNSEGVTSCEQLPMVRIYYIGMIILLITHIVVSMLLCICSMQGSIIDIRRRRGVPVVLYVKAFLFLPEIIWLLLGTFWAFMSPRHNCVGVVVITVKALVVVGWVMFLSMLIGILFVFDPLGHRRRRGHAPSTRTGSIYMDRNTDGAGTATKQLWETRCKFICCCAADDEDSNNAFNDIAQLFTNFFQGLDLVPTDIAAGMILVQHAQRRAPQRLKRTRLIVQRTSPPSPNKPKLSKNERKKLKDRDRRLPPPGFNHAHSIDDAPASQGKPWVLQDDEAHAFGHSATAFTEPAEVLLELPPEEDSPLVSMGLNTNSNANNMVVPSAEPSPSTPTFIPARPHGARQQPKGWMSIHNATHYMKFAMASYGWPLYMYTNLPLGLCKLWSKCRSCCCGSQNLNVHNDNPCQCHTAAIRNLTGIQDEDIIYASFHNAIYQIPFYVVLDHSRSAVIISIRGTLSFRDALTDLTAESFELNIPGVKSPCKVHKGIMQAASYVNRMLKEAAILETAFSMAPNYQLIVTGHSLGAGAATLLAIMLRPDYPDLKTFAFSPPGGLLSVSLARYTEDFVCSVVLGHDLVPRLGIVSMEDLKAHVLRCVKDSHKPKYKILASGIWTALCGLPKTEEESSGTRQPLLSSDEISVRIACYGSQEETLSERQLEDAILMSGRSRQVQLSLFPPGQILYIEEDNPASTCCGDPGYTAAWACPEVFEQVLVSPKMLSDHLPDTVFKALTQLADKNFHISEMVTVQRTDSIEEGLL